MTDRVWSCKIGPQPNDIEGMDAPMRGAVQRAFRDLFGIDAEFCFSGWSDLLTRSEQDVVNLDRGSPSQRSETGADRGR